MPDPKPANVNYEWRALTGYELPLEGSDGIYYRLCPEVPIGASYRPHLVDPFFDKAEEALEQQRTT